MQIRERALGGELPADNSSVCKIVRNLCAILLSFSFKRSSGMVTAPCSLACRYWCLGLVRNGRRRCGRGSPGDIGKVEEVEQTRLRRVAGCQVCRTADEAILDKLDNRGVVHRGVADIVRARERGNDHIGHAETELRGKALFRRCIAGIGARIVRRQIAIGRGAGLFLPEARRESMVRD